MAAAVLEALALALTQVLQSQARLWLSLLLVALPRDTLIVVAALLLTPILGAAGLAAAYLIGWSVALVSTVVLAIRLGIHGGTIETPHFLPTGAVDAGRL
jgi:hypothetical protein